MIILLDEGPVQILANVRGTVPLIYALQTQFDL
jgi:hypothetical protein